MGSKVIGRKQDQPAKAMIRHQTKTHELQKENVDRAETPAMELNPKTTKRRKKERHEQNMEMSSVSPVEMDSMDIEQKEFEPSKASIETPTGSQLKFRHAFRPSARVESISISGRSVLSFIDGLGVCLLGVCGEQFKVTRLDSSQVLCTLEPDGDVITTFTFDSIRQMLYLASRSLLVYQYALKYQTEQDEGQELQEQTPLTSDIAKKSRESPSMEENKKKEISKGLHAQKVCSWKMYDQPCLYMESDPWIGRYLAMGAVDGTIRVWDTKQGGVCTHSFCASIEHKSPISSIKWCKLTTMANPEKEISISTDHQRASRQKRRERKGYASPSIFMEDHCSSSKEFPTCTANCWHLITANDDGKIHIWNLLTKSLHTVLSNHFSSVRDLQISDCGRFLFSAGHDRVINIWDLSKGSLMKTLTVFEPLECISLHTVPAGPFLKESLHGRKESKNPINSTFKENSDMDLLSSYVVCSGGEKGVIRAWKCVSGDCIATWNICSTSPPYLDPNRSTICKEANQVPIVGMSVLKAHKCLKDKQTIQKNTGDIMLIVNAHRTLTVCDASHVPDSLPIVRQLLGHVGELIDIQWLHVVQSIDGKEDQSGSINRRSPLNLSSYLLVATTSETLKVLRLGSTSTMSIQYDGTDSASNAHLRPMSLNCEIVSGHADTILCLDAHVFTEVNSRGLNNSTITQFPLFVTGSKDRTARLWTIVDESLDDSMIQMDHLNGLGICGPSFRFSVHCLAICHGHTDAVSAVALSRKRNTGHLSTGSLGFLVTASQDRTIKLWDILTKTTHGSEKGSVDCHVRFTISAHDKDINAISISPNNKYIISASQDKTAIIWSAQDGTRLYILRGHKRGVWTACFSPIEQCVVTGSSDGTLRMWNVQDGTCLFTLDGRLYAIQSRQSKRSEKHTTDAMEESVLSVFRTCFTNELPPIFADHWKVSTLSHRPQLISSGSDGCVRVWNAERECVSVLEMPHKDKIWTLTSGWYLERSSIVNSKEMKMAQPNFYIASGSADGIIQFWQDISEQVFQVKQQNMRERVLKEQKLEDCLVHGDYCNGLMLVIELDQPFQAFRILSTILESERMNPSSPLLENVLESLNDDCLRILLHYISQWNTHVKTSSIAHRILHRLAHLRRRDWLVKQLTFGVAAQNDQGVDFMRSETPQGIESISTSISQPSSDKALRFQLRTPLPHDWEKGFLRGMVPYTEKHLERIHQWLRRSYFVDYVLQHMLA